MHKPQPLTVHRDGQWFHIVTPLGQPVDRLPVLADEGLAEEQLRAAEYRAAAFMLAEAVALGTVDVAGLTRPGCPEHLHTAVATLRRDLTDSGW